MPILLYFVLDWDREYDSQQILALQAARVAASSIDATSPSILEGSICQEHHPNTAGVFEPTCRKCTVGKCLRFAIKRCGDGRIYHNQKD